MQPDHKAEIGILVAIIILITSLFTAGFTIGYNVYPAKDGFYTTILVNNPFEEPLVLHNITFYRTTQIEVVNHQSQILPGEEIQLALLKYNVAQRSDIQAVGTFIYFDDGTLFLFLIIQPYSWIEL